MKVSTTDGKTFELSAQTEEDLDLIHALDMHGLHVQCTDIARSRIPSGPGLISSGATLVIDPTDPQALRLQTARKLLSAFSEVVRLGLGEATQHGLACAAPTNPQAQEQLAASLEKLQVVTDALLRVVGKQEVEVEEVQRTHGSPLAVENPTVKE